MTKAESKTSISLLNEWLFYDPKTGGIFWKKNRSSRARAGTTAGCIGHNGYVKLQLLNQPLLGHRVAFALATGNWPKNLIDHKDGNPSNNRLENLREATRSQNSWNYHSRKNNKSGARGVYWDKKAKRWVAQITYKRKTHHLGNFTQFHYAVITAMMARKAMHREFSNHTP